MEIGKLCKSGFFPSLGRLLPIVKHFKYWLVYSKRLINELNSQHFSQVEVRWDLKATAGTRSGQGKGG